jgi:hypothetical protein
MPRPFEPEGFRYCSKCSSIKPLENFPRDKSEKFGRAYLCSPCQNKKHRENHAKRVSENPNYKDEINLKKRLTLQERKKLAIEYKGGVCVDCGGKFPPCVYDFHHLDPKEKDYNPSAASRLTLKTMFKELEKCVLLCSNCHRIRHYGDISSLN